MPYSDNRELVSIGIPFYNSEKFLKDAIRSVFSQTYVEWELILVDDGSGDRSLEICRAVADPRVRVISDGKHLGLIKRLNQIIGLSRGKYIARMDSDDLMHPQRIEQQVGFLKAHPEVDVVGAGMYSLGKGFTIIGKRNVSPVSGKVKGFIHVSVLGKKEWFFAHNYDPYFVRAEDQELWWRTYKTSNFANLEIPLMYVREIDSVTFSKYAQSSRTMRRVFRTHGFKNTGILLALALIVQSYLKVFLYGIAGIFGRQDVLVSKRNMPLSIEEEKSAKEAITVVLKTAVNGLGHEDSNP